jgi:hypothetical protein
MLANIKRRLAKLESIKDDPLAELERANPYLAVMRAAWKKVLGSPAGAAMEAEFNELLGPIQVPPTTGHAGIDARNTLNAMFDAMGASVHRERLFELQHALEKLEFEYLAAERARPETDNAHAG